MEKAAGRRAEHRRGGQKSILGEREKRRLLQLVVCLVVFLAVFFAKGMDRLEILREDLLRALRSDVDIETAFADLGWSLASGKSVGKSLGGLWTDVFIPQERECVPVWGEGLLYQSVRRELQTGNGLLKVGREEQRPVDPMASSGRRMESTPDAAQEPAPAPEPSTEEPAVVYMDYTGPALPDNTTMDRHALGLQETMSPVEATLTSGFGWREHPISGGEKFHYGVDLAAELGTTVRAFAAGTVDYIGESDIYGQYLQLDHGNGVTSFYAHCSKLCVQKGQRVALGEKVAESGATGQVTGPHLHFEMKKDGVRLNPAYYLSLLT